MPDITPIDPPAIVITASRAEEDAAATPASLTIVDAKRVERLAPPLIADLLRLAPSVAVSTSGPAGSLTQVRIRGSEANHSLLFIDGIRANDPAAGNEPRFELVNADLASRVELVRGPQSALWGSEAIGGVIAVTGPAPGDGPTSALVEVGSFATRRGAARASIGDNETGVSLGIAGQRSVGIDSFTGHGERDGYRNLALRGAGRVKLTAGLSAGASAFALRGLSEYDGLDPATFVRADTLDETRNRLSAGRLFVEGGQRDASYVKASAGLLRSSNRNLLGDAPINRTSAARRSIGIEAGHRIGRHRLIIAAEGERETFRARDVGFGGFTNQDRSRRHPSLTVEWLGDFKVIKTDLAIRRDVFSRFEDATTVRASVLGELGGGLQFAATYGQGIAQPSFFDLFGFFPGSFAGNPALRPERSRGGELSLRYRRHSFDAALTAYRQRLDDEILDVFDSTTFLASTANAVGRSRRQGWEVEAGWRPSPAVRLSGNYASLEASEPGAAPGTELKEQRRPRHSGSIALDGARGRLSYGASIAVIGKRIDTDFDRYPAVRVRLDAYALASARLAYRFAKGVEAHVRIANAFDADYQDVVGYRTEGRSVHAGLRLDLGR